METCADEHSEAPLTFEDVIFHQSTRACCDCLDKVGFQTCQEVEDKD